MERKNSLRKGKHAYAAIGLHDVVKSEWLEVSIPSFSAVGKMLLTGMVAVYGTRSSGSHLAGTGIIAAEICGSLNLWWTESQHNETVSTNRSHWFELCRSVWESPTIYAYYFLVAFITVRQHRTRQGSKASEPSFRQPLNQPVPWQDWLSRVKLSLIESKVLKKNIIKILLKQKYLQSEHLGTIEDIHRKIELKEGTRFSTNRPIVPDKDLKRCFVII